MMTSLGAFASPRPDLDVFLFAEVGTERSGMALSVLSALARFGVDPRQEASRLSQLPRPAAVESLAGTITNSPASPWSPAEAAAIAARLVALLPDANRGTLSLPPVRVQNWRAFCGLALALLATFLLGFTLSRSGPANNAAAARAPALAAYPAPSVSSPRP